MDLDEQENPQSPKNLSNYLITKDGKVFSKLRNRWLTATNNNVGYKQVFLKQDQGKSKWFKVHRLVALTYIPNPDNKPEVNHIDGNKENNHYTNLEWITHSDNILHSFRKLGRKTPTGKDHWLFGKEVSNKTKALMSQKKLGESHPRFKGWYIHEGKRYASCEELAKTLNTYPMQAYRMYKRGLIGFESKTNQVTIE